MSNKVPERLVNFRAYLDGTDLLGTATVELPELEAMSDTVSGAGIAGEVESPILGHYGSMTTTFSWRTITNKAAELCAPKAHSVEIYGSMQEYDAGNGTYNTVQARASMKIVPKTSSLGSFEPGATTDTEQEFEVLYLKLFIGGKEVMEIDKYNFIAKFNGTDYLASVRKDLGLA